jgi:exosortase
VGQEVLSLWGIPVLREGNVIVLATTTLEVAEACSGIRSLVSLVTLGIVYGYFTDPRATVRLAIALSSVPVAIAANGLRVAGTGIAAHYYGLETATGFFHTFSGWLVFLVSFGMLLVVARAATFLLPAPRPPIAPIGLRVAA